MYYSDKLPLHLSLPDLAVFVHNTRQVATANNVTFSSIRYSTNQFARSFIEAATMMWNGLPSAVVESTDLQTFKKGANTFLSADIT